MFENPLYRVSQNLKPSFMTFYVTLCPQRIFTGLDPTLPHTACSSVPQTACSLTYHLRFSRELGRKSALSFLHCSP